MHRNPQKSCAALLLAALVLLPMTAIAQAAAPLVDLAQKGCLSILLQDTGKSHAPISNATVRIHLIADADGSDAALRYVLTATFQDCGRSLTDQNTPELARHLAQYASEQHLIGMEQQTDPSGRATFSDLPLGIYLVTQAGTVSGYEPIRPFLITLPLANAEGSGWLYAVTALPKTQPTEPHPIVPPVDPAPIPSCPADSSSTDPIAAEPATPPSSAPLLQTGQLNWPIPVLTLCGLLLWRGGFLLRKPYERETSR